MQKLKTDIYKHVLFTNFLRKYSIISLYINTTLNISHHSTTLFGRGGATTIYLVPKNGFDVVGLVAGRRAEQRLGHLVVSFALDAKASADAHRTKCVYQGAQSPFGLIRERGRRGNVKIDSVIASHKKLTRLPKRCTFKSNSIYRLPQ